MRRLLALFLLLAGFFPAVSLAACPAAGCGASQFCARDSRIPDGSACYATCDPEAAGGGTCTGGLRCVSVSGQGVCVPPDSPLVTGGASSNPRCDAGRSCPSTRTYECVSGECLIPNGQRCENSMQCFSGSRCEGSGSSMVCNAAPSGASGSSDAEVEPPFQSITPVLGVPVPGVTLSPATRNNDEVNVPFLAQYINGFYRYGVTIVLIIAIVMVVYGGFRYLVGASLGDIQAGKKIIQDALIGMLVVLGAYMILNTVNPETLNLTVLRLPFVDEMRLLMTTTVPTADWEGSDASSGGTTRTEASGLPFDPGAESPYSSCPVSLTAPIATSPYSRRDARVEEFMSEMAPTLRSMGVRERVLAASAAATACGIHMGSCGNTTITINELAGVGGAGNREHTIGSDNVRYLTEINQDCVRNHPGDRECKSQARASAFDRFSEQLEGWPNEWAATLRPGDHIWMYTAHSGGAGQHAAIFLGWASPGRARVFNGQWEGNVRESTYCITTDCRNVYPLTQVWSPD